jgi:hypothetical protein
MVKRLRKAGIRHSTTFHGGTSGFGMHIILAYTWSRLGIVYKLINYCTTLLLYFPLVP